MEVVCRLVLGAVMFALAAGCQDRPEATSVAGGPAGVSGSSAESSATSGRVSSTPLPESTVAGRNRCVIYFDKDAFGLDEAEATLRQRRLSVSRAGDALRAWRRNGPVLTIRLQRGPAVREDAGRLGRGTQYADRLAGCGSRLEITFDDLDKVLDEINTLIEVQGALEAATPGGHVQRLERGVLRGCVRTGSAAEPPRCTVHEPRVALE